MSNMDSIGTDSSSDEDQQIVDDSLDDDGLDGALDKGYSPPDRPFAVNSFGTTAAEMAQGESLEQRLAQEEPDPAAAFDDPLADQNDADGADDPDSQDAEDEDFVSDREVGDQRAGRLVDPDEGAHTDREARLLGHDVGIDGAAASAEEAAMHVIDEL